MSNFLRFTKKASIKFVLIVISMFFGGFWAAANEGESMSNEPISIEELVEHLNLEGHIEGGYFRRTFQADHRDKVSTSSGDRFTMTSIHYLLTGKSPIGHWHLNQSDIIHFYHSGLPITYYVIDPKGQLSSFVLGPDPRLGHHFQYAVKGGSWKASYLGDMIDKEQDYGLISEAVAPGFEYSDMTLGEKDKLTKLYPQHKVIIEKFSKQ